MLKLNKLTKIFLNITFLISGFLLTKNDSFAGRDDNDGNYYSSCGIRAGCISDGGARICRRGYLSGSTSTPSGDIEAQSITIYDAEAYPGEGYYLGTYMTSGSAMNPLVYWKEGSTVRQKTGLIPGRKYRIVASYRYTGETMIREYCKNMGPGSAVTYLGHPSVHHVHYPYYYWTTCSCGCNARDENGKCTSYCYYSCQRSTHSSSCYDYECNHRAYYWQGYETVTETVVNNYTIRKNSGSALNSANDISYFDNATSFRATSNGAIDDRKYEDVTLWQTTGIGRYTDVLVYEYPYVSFTMNIQSVTYSWSNDRTTNDTLNMTINDGYDISVSNVSVSPGYIYTNGTSQTVYYNVTYDAKLTVPSYVYSGPAYSGSSRIDDYQTLAKTSITINGKVFYVEDMLLVGNNTQLSHVLEVPSTYIPSSGSLQVIVNVNYDKDSWEYGSNIYSNNTITKNSATTIYNVANPKTSSYLNKNVSPSLATSNSYSSSVGGRKNDNCSVPRTYVQFTTTHRVLTWKATKTVYNKIYNATKSNGIIASKGTSVNDFYQYETVSNTSKTNTYTEYLNITNIYFKSKETVDRGYSSSRGTGWIDILSTPSRAIVSAGYGFELEVVVKYSTNAFSLQPSESYGASQTSSKSSKSSTYTTTNVSGLNGRTNFGLEDLFVELPGTSSGKKVLSSTGYGSSTRGLNQSSSGGYAAKTWTYTIKGTTSPSGVQTTSKIYVPESTSDASYKLRIYTPPMSGVSSVSKNANMIMCDRKDVEIIVIGSAYDDLNGHEVQ